MLLVNLQLHRTQKYPSLIDLLSYLHRSIHHNPQAKSWRHRAIPRAVFQMNPPFVMHIVLYQSNPRETNGQHHHILNYLFILTQTLPVSFHLQNWKNPENQDGSVYLSSSKNNKFLSFMMPTEVLTKKYVRRSYLSIEINI